MQDKDARRSKSYGNFFRMLGQSGVDCQLSLPNYRISGSFPLNSSCMTRADIDAR
ncbi:hypothetical protein [Sphingomonas panacis]|uniref:hypothetical protein n=1 Tax=Sphingomonas panacis TaxID=1560345 RepID=UPI0014711E5F|nr:hypothetical protein [Sphingomonas panacis]